MTDPLAASAAKPCGDSIDVIRLPIVLMIRQPPVTVPSEIAAAHTNLTHSGTEKLAALRWPVEISASAMMPIVFWASFVPWASDTSAADPTCPYR